MNHNILITSVGKRVSLVKFFQKELKNKFPNANVYTTELNPQLSPAAYICDKCFEVPRVTNPNYINCILQICIENKIGIVIPTIDTELRILAEYASEFKTHGIIIIVSSLKFINTCRDKRNTITLFEQLNIPYPTIRDKNNPVFPMFAKPYDGSLSTNLHVINNADELTPEILNDNKLIFMDLIDKSTFQEYTIDMYYGKDNKVKSIVPRERLAIRAGEINKGITRKNFIVEYLKEQMGYLHGVIGCICVQLFVNHSTRQIYAIEINPRFGGGYPLSYHSGANYPRLIIEEYFEDKEIKYSDNWLDKTLMLRYDDDIIIHNYND